MSGFWPLPGYANDWSGYGGSARLCRPGMGQGRNRRDAQPGAPGAGSLRGEPRGPRTPELLPDLRPSGARHPAHGGTAWRGAAQRGDGTPDPGPPGRLDRRGWRSPAGADAGHPATAGLPGPGARQPQRPAAAAARPAQRPAPRAGRPAAAGNQPVQSRTEPVDPAAAAGSPGAAGHPGVLPAAAQAAPAAAGSHGGTAARP